MSPPDSAYVARVLVAVSIGAAAAIIAVATWMGFYLLLLLLFALLLGVAFSGLASSVSWLTKLPYGLSLALVLLLLAGLLVGVSVPTFPVMRDQLRQLSDQLPEALSRLESRVEQTWLGRKVMEEVPLDLDAEEGKDEVEDGSGGGRPEPTAPEQPAATKGDGGGSPAGVVSLAERALGFMATTVGALATFGLVLYVAVAVAATPRVYLDGGLRLLPMRRRARALEVLLEVGRALRWWLAGRAVSMTAVGLITWFGLWMLEVPLALSLAVLAGLLTFVPNIGPIAAAIPAVLLGLNDGFATAAWVVALYVFAQLAEGLLVTPLVDYKVVYVPPALTIVLQLLLGLAAGVIGVLMAAPIAAAAIAGLKLLLREEEAAGLAVA